MTVGIVNPIQYSSIEQYRYFSISVSNDRLNQLMKDYGIQVTGDADKDLQALYEAMLSTATKNVAYEMPVNAQNTNQPQAPQPQQQSAPPWTALMNYIGLSPTGDFSSDYNAFNNKIQAMQQSATSPQQKANIAQLQAEAQIVFVPPAQGQAGIQQGQAKSPTPSGADISAMLNQLFLVG